MPSPALTRILLTGLLFSTAAIASEGGKSAASLARAAEEAATRARYEQSEREVEAILRSRKEAIRRENGGPRTAPKRDQAGKTEPVNPRTAWTYDGEAGPENWGKLRPEWARCASGNRQSPIDIRDGIAVDLEKIAFDYKPSSFNVVDNGHTVQVNVGAGNSISLTGRTYQLQQFHFHLPAEEKIDGRGFEMVAHLVHKDAEGRLAVVAALIESGDAHPLVQTVWNNLPLEKHEPVAPQVTIDIGQLLPERHEYYTYMGSLTTPPCSEGVLWIVLKQPIQVSPQQIAIFSRLYPMNARPVQSQAGRLIKQSH